MDGPLFLAGPTGSGKSELALRLAPILGGEIVSVDSMQVYRGMDIGTGKASAAERRAVKHHLISILDLSESFDAAQFVHLAKAAAADIASRARVPIFCGGTGLYFKAYLNGLGQAPPSDGKVRSELELLPTDVLLQELEARDPVTHSRVDHNNRRRVVRALEVIRLTDKPFSQQRAGWANGSASGSEPGRNPAAPRFFCLEREKAELYRRIDARVDKMFALGLVEETRALLDTGLAENRTALQALGYRQVYEHLQGKRSLAETVELVKRNTRQYAKRQMTWFRHQVQLQWIRIEEGEEEANVAKRILRLL